MSTLKVWKGTALDTTKVPVVDGQLLFETDTKKIYLDSGTSRLQVGGQDSIAWANVTGKPTIPTTTSQLTNDSFYFHLKGGTTTIPNNSDLNSYTTPGLYTSGSSTNSTTLTNAPTTDTGFKLFVVDGYISGRVTQFATGNSHSLWYRQYNGSSWTEWVTPYTKLNKPTLSDLGVTATATELNYVDGVTSKIQTQLNAKLPLAGGTITGAITANTASGKDMAFIESRGDVSVGMGIGSGNTNHGVYSFGLGKWMVYSDGTNVYLNGKADAATKDGSGNTITSTYLKLSGGTLTGDLTISKSTTIANNTPISINFKMTQTDNSVSSTSYIRVYDDLDAAGNGNNMVIASMSGTYLCAGEGAASYLANNASTGENVHICADSTIYFHTNCNTVANATTSCYINTSGYIYGSRVYGAVWNDYAEYRATVPNVKPGQVVVENGDGTLRISTERLQPGCEIVSDTFGFAIGETDDCKTPIAATGRVLAYTYEDRDTFVAGEPVCSGPNGTVSRMTREEAKEYPERIIGTVSEIPSYTHWGTGNVEVDNRIWIRIR